MKTFTAAIIVALSALSAAQELAPSPTESVGYLTLIPHGHCDGPREAAPATTATPVIINTSISVTVPATTTAAPQDDHDHEDEEDHDDHSSGVLAPSPTGSVGCEPHGDHWHCEGPAAPVTTIATVTTSGVASGTDVPVTTNTGPAFTAGASSVHGSLGAAAGIVGLIGFAIGGI
ncbi:hypothetical protein QBC40DRAFT_330135 [Triangularia verruculosa]|uniref:GPI anchored protein n=1 Tax=Triangularia verruculosa TaxID=2587418 RepID=A0AAN6XHY6_9PEZI|nr:hypothetical protein QBC40DRAFT_330135 [Triangularia verruculosa]